MKDILSQLNNFASLPPQLLSGPCVQYSSGPDLVPSSRTVYPRD